MPKFMFKRTPHEACPDYVEGEVVELPDAFDAPRQFPWWIRVEDEPSSKEEPKPNPLADDHVYLVTEEAPPEIRESIATTKETLDAFPDLTVKDQENNPITEEDKAKLAENPSHTVLVKNRKRRSKPKS